MTTNAPHDWGEYQRTYNNAIDLVIQAVGYHKRTMKPLKAIVLKPTSFDLFKSGLDVLSKKKQDTTSQLYFEGIEIKRGKAFQFDTMKFEFYPLPAPPQMRMDRR
jgi:hypothetical protein